jgi:histidyl-tRNA synthetase
MSQNIRRPKGTQDVTVSEIGKWHYAESLLRRKAELFGFRETRFPVFEHTELFIRGVGDTTDVVQKEMYTFTDKGGRSITLRPEGTASTVRSYIENGEAQNGAPYKAYYIVPNFRYEQPQAGRLREHHQFGTECFGAAGYLADAELISLAASFLKDLKISAALRINSIGCPECRPKYYAALREYFAARESELCDTCRERLAKNPMRILDCKSEICREIAAGAPRALDYLCDECRDHFEGLKETLTALKVPFEVDTSIVRGLDYYTKTVFEFVFTGIGAQGTVCGGGRYDGLVEELGGPHLPAAGFAMGITRLILAMDQCGIKVPEPPSPVIYIAPLGAAAQAKASLLTYELRKAGICAECDIVGRSLKSQMKYADKIGCANVLIIGDSELETGRASLINMKT